MRDIFTANGKNCILLGSPFRNTHRYQKRADNQSAVALTVTGCNQELKCLSTTEKNTCTYHQSHIPSYHRHLHLFLNFNFCAFKLIISFYVSIMLYLIYIIWSGIILWLDRIDARIMIRISESDLFYCDL